MLLFKSGKGHVWLKCYAFLKSKRSQQFLVERDKFFGWGAFDPRELWFCYAWAIAEAVEFEREAPCGLQYLVNFFHDLALIRHLPRREQRNMQVFWWDEARGKVREFGLKFHAFTCNEA